MDKTYQIYEIFHSIQGEGTRAGLPCVFVRFQGCNLRCVWCDTAYAQDIGRGIDITQEEIIEKVEQYECRFIEFTGGEPLLQKELNYLLEYFIQKKYTVAIETNGSMDISALPAGVVRIMDIKCPSSGMQDKFLYANLNHLTETDEIKFVIASREDYLWAKDILQRQIGGKVCPEILFSPAFSLLAPQKLAEWILKDHLPVRFQLQLHKYIWDPERKGV